jgi:hypothetical protein
MRLIFSIFFTTSILICTGQTVRLGKPSSILYSGIYNKVFIDCNNCKTQEFTIKTDSLSKFAITYNTEGGFFIKPNYGKWSDQNANLSEKKTLYIYNANIFLDSIIILVKQLPRPDIKFNSYGHGGIGSWLRFDSLTIKSDLFNELALTAKIDSFSVLAYGKIDSTQDDTTYFKLTNIGNIFTTDIKERVYRLPLNATFRCGPIYITVEGLPIIIDDWYVPIVGLGKEQKVLK